MKGKVTGHRLLIKPDSLEEVSEGGLIIARPKRDEQMEKAAMNRGTVVQVGNTAYKADYLGNEPWCKEGDKVIFVKYEGKTIVDPETDQAYLIINDEDVLVVLEKE
jgi:co-chaperonin GroES (HSP10)